MIDDNRPLLVPIALDALAVTREARTSQNFQRWRMTYSSLDSFHTPEPAPFSGLEEFSTHPENEGVYLLWTLPAALRHGTQTDRSSGAVTFPLVPNRWLIVRYSGPSDRRTATAWVIESDHRGANATEATSPYADPLVDRPAPIWIGRKVSLTAEQPWHETSTAPLFLRAIGPGDASFAAYQPNVENVFSFHDDLTTQGVEQDTLSYLVAGWYSNPGQDILGTWQAGVQGNDYADVLTRLLWVVQDGAAMTARQSLYHGMVHGIHWDVNGPIPPSARDTAVVSVAVGNSSIDALTALIKAQAADRNDASAVTSADLLEAFQYNLLPALDQPGGQQIVAQSIRDAWFDSGSGGTLWQLVDQEVPLGTQPPPSLGQDVLDAQHQALAALNRAQVELDRQRFELASRQRDFYEMWWKNGYATALGELPYRTSADQFRTALDPGDPNSLPSRVIQQLGVVRDRQAAVDTALAAVPMATVDRTDQASANGASGDTGDSSRRRLKATAMPRFWEAGDPVVVVAGVNHGSVIDPAETLTCRYADPALTSDSGGPAIAALPLGALPPAIGGLVKAYSFLDPANADPAARAVVQAFDPATVDYLRTGMAAWTQPWLPLYFEWELDWYAIPYQEGGTPRWRFDGTDYHWTGQLTTTPEPQPIAGRSLLTPKLAFTFKARLEQFITDNPDEASLAALDTWIQTVDQWDLLSQTLSGFSSQVALRDASANVAPHGTTVTLPDGTELSYSPDQSPAALIDDQYHAVPQSLLRSVPRHHQPPPSTFEAMRNGQLVFTRLTIVDRFGQTIEVLNSNNSETFHPIVAAGLAPQQTVLGTEAARFVELPPRLAQRARLGFTVVSAADDTREIDLNADVEPIRGFVLPNHLDQALAVYDRTGRYLGELRIIDGLDGNQRVFWDQAPLAPFATLDALAVQHRHLGGFLSGLQSKGADVFQAFMAAIDETLWTVDPRGERYDQNLVVLMGRPLALVRARLRFELDRSPLADPAWPWTFAPSSPLFTGYEFPVGLGNQDDRRDGLLGYFRDEDYDQFYAVHDPDPGDVQSGGVPYVKQIGEGSYLGLRFDGSAQFVTLLVDPRGSVQARTGLLPTKTLELSARDLDAALGAMEVTFRTGPLLTSEQLVVSNQAGDGGVGTTGQQQTPSLLMPIPTEKDGTWSWVELAGAVPNEVSIASIDARARFPTRAPTLREGLLRLVGATRDEQSPPSP